MTLHLLEQTSVLLTTCNELLLSDFIVGSNIKTNQIIEKDFNRLCVVLNIFQNLLLARPSNFTEMESLSPPLSMVLLPKLFLLAFALPFQTWNYLHCNCFRHFLLSVFTPHYSKIFLFKFHFLYSSSFLENFHGISHASSDLANVKRDRQMVDHRFFLLAENKDGFC